MSYKVIATEPFERKVKKLAKKYKSIKADLTPIFKQLANEPTLGTPLGKECYKIRIAIASKTKGKSGGGRLITLVRVVNKKVFLLDIYDKSEKSTITDKELRLLIELLAEK